MKKCAMNLRFLTAFTAVLAVTAGSVPAYSKPTGVPVHPSARCAVFWSAMTRSVPQDSPAHKEMTARKNAWLADAAASIGQPEANRILNAHGPYYGNQVREMAGNATALQAFAAKYSNCNSVPASRAITRSNGSNPAFIKPIPAVTEKDKANGVRALACAGMARTNEDMGNIPAVELFGKSSVYLRIIKHFRPDFAEADIKSGIVAAQIDYAKLVTRNHADRHSHTMTGKPWDIKKSELLVFSRECARMANVMARIVQMKP